MGTSPTDDIAPSFVQLFTHTILNFRSITERENNPQAVANILLANQHHLEHLRLELRDYGERGDPLILPRNLKYLCVFQTRHDDQDEVLSELAVEQCPKLCGFEFTGILALRTINAISRFEKFVAHSTDYLDYTQYHYFIIIICLIQSHISGNSFVSKLSRRRARCYVSFRKPSQSSRPGSHVVRKFPGFIYYY